MTAEDGEVLSIADFIEEFLHDGGYVAAVHYLRAHKLDLVTGYAASVKHRPKPLPLAKATLRYLPCCDHGPNSHRGSEGSCFGLDGNGLRERGKICDCRGYSPGSVDMELTQTLKLHSALAHPDWEYTTVVTGRKSGEDNTPQGEGWEPNYAFCNGWERFDYTEESYWRRRKTPVAS